VHAKFSGNSKWLTPETTLSEYIHKYAPAKDKNKPVEYTEFMADKFNQLLGENVITKDTPVSDLQEALLDAGYDATHIITQAHLSMENPRILKDLNITFGKTSVTPAPMPEARKATATQKKPAVKAELTPPTQLPSYNFSGTVNTTSPQPNPQPTKKEQPVVTPAPTVVKTDPITVKSTVDFFMPYSKTGELIKSAIDQGIGSALSQAWAGATSPNQGLQQSIKPLPEKEVTVAPSKTTKVDSKPIVKEKPPAYVPIGSKIENYKGDSDRYLEPFKVNVESAKFGVRSRKEERDIQTKAVVFTTYKPWTYASSPEFTKGADSFDYFLVVNNETGDLKVTTNPWRDNNSLLNKPAVRANPNMLTTGSYGRIVKELNMSGKYNDGILSKTLGYVSHDGKKASIPVFGIGNGSDLGGYIGGKLLLAHPDGSNPTIIYGSAEIVIDQFNKYKKENNLKNVLVIDADGKSYAQSYQTKSGVIQGSKLTSANWDNANTSTAGSGNILYLK
jgi:hypothetical protein